MRIRWVAAALGAVTLAVLTMTLPVRWKREAPRPAAAGCPQDAKPANLNFTLKDTNGRDVRLSDYKGKVILLDFWATWCAPCKYEIPVFVQLQEKYGKDGFQVIGVSVDDTPEELEPFIERFKMNYPVLLGLGHDDVQDAYGPMFAMPINVVISRDGKICAKHLGVPPKSAEKPLENTVRDIFEAEITALLFAD